MLKGLNATEDKKAMNESKACWQHCKLQKQSKLKIFTVADQVTKLADLQRQNQ